jgi:hypothetical protein
MPDIREPHADMARLAVRLPVVARFLLAIGTRLRMATPWCMRWPQTIWWT